MVQQYAQLGHHGLEPILGPALHTESLHCRASRPGWTEELAGDSADGASVFIISK